MDNLAMNNESFEETLMEEKANCNNLTDYETNVISIVQWALEYVCILFVGITGFLGNCVAIYILTSSEKMNSAFNKGWIMYSPLFSKVNVKFFWALPLDICLPYKPKYFSLFMSLSNDDKYMIRPSVADMVVCL